MPTETVTKWKPHYQTGTTIFETSPSQGRHSLKFVTVGVDNDNNYC